MRPRPCALLTDQQLQMPRQTLPARMCVTAYIVFQLLVRRTRKKKGLVENEATEWHGKRNHVYPYRTTKHS